MERLNTPDSVVSRMDPSLPATLQHSRNRIARWLLHGPAQLRTGSQLGGLVGWVDEAGRADCVYGEIAGYYLQWLAWHATQEGVTVEVQQRARAAQTWLTQNFVGTHVPDTRIYLDGHKDDWRNRIVFCFDLAMLLRGLASAALLGLIRIEPTTVARIARELSLMIAGDGILNPWRPRSEPVQLPARWSTQRHPFLAKAAAAILLAGEHLPLPGSLVEAAAKTFEACVDWARQGEPDNTHALLYFVEGVLSLEWHPRFEVAMGVVQEQFSALIRRIETLGYVPELLPEGGVQRSDTVAQVIRAGSLIDAYSPASPSWDDQLSELVEQLTAQVREDGTVPFSSDAGSPLNVWCAMFTEQALALAADGRRGILKRNAARWLV